MAKYRRIPIIVEAEQWFWDKPVDGVGLLDDHPMRIPDGSRGKYGYINTPEGGYIVSPGDWIITSLLGEKYTCKDVIFKLTYELVEE